MAVYPPTAKLEAPPTLTFVLQPIAEVDTVTVAVFTIEVWPVEVLVRLIGLPWNSTAQQYQLRPGQLPPLSQLKIKLADANGLHLEWKSASGGGGEYGRWRIDHSFVRNKSVATEKFLISALSAEGREIHTVAVAM